MKINIFSIIFGILFSFICSQINIAQTKVDTLDGEYSIEWLKDNCCSNELDSTIDCEIRHFDFMDSLDHHAYYYAQYLYEKNGDISSNNSDEEQQYYGQALVVFESQENSSQLRPVWDYFTKEGEYFEEPLIKMTKYGCILHPNINSGGNRGLGDDDSYYIRKNNHWYKLNNPNYDEVLKSELPKGYYIDSASPIDLRNMTYSVYVYKPNDGGCCPTGGDITASLEIHQFDIVIVNVVYKEDSQKK